jgi:hypothetical protein
MRFVLISRHTGGADIPESESGQNLKDMGAWLTLLKASVAIPIRGGKSITSGKVEEYAGDIGGMIIYEAEDLAQAVALARKSPGLKYGFTHEVFPEVQMGIPGND